MVTTPTFPTDYDQYAPTYAWARWAVPWVVAPLVRALEHVPKGSTILEAGCGTGNYICALAAVRPELAYIGFDLSQPMLDQARARATPVRFVRSDATSAFPCRDTQCALVFAVDVVHHLEDLMRFFQEARRVLETTGRVVIVTDSEQARPVFRALRQLRAELRDRAPLSSWAELSMGMTDDFEIAIEEGSNIVRIGRAIFR